LVIHMFSSLAVFGHPRVLGFGPDAATGARATEVRTPRGRLVRC
jgi:hypothetical protein